MADKNNSKTHKEVTQELLAAGKISEKGLEKARQQLEEDPEWQAFLASQPKRKQA
ncbi:hypothetical protein [Adhaeribacter terreus]|uniref:Uncharacterized protein n=1 Tax=Adhaeribacter terreus TaxID=529703 RepID=A0ABW0E9W6_9BACT